MMRLTKFFRSAASCIRDIGFGAAAVSFFLLSGFFVSWAIVLIFVFFRTFSGEFFKDVCLSLLLSLLFFFLHWLAECLQDMWDFEILAARWHAECLQDMWDSEILAYRWALPDPNAEDEILSPFSGSYKA
jgi:hypothetical protein